MLGFLATLLVSCHRDKPDQRICFPESAKSVCLQNDDSTDVGSEVLPRYATYAAARQALQAKMKEIKGSHYPPLLQDYLCCAAVAELWYSACGFPFGEGITLQQSSRKEECMKKPLAYCYELAANNQVTYNCYERSILTLRTAHELLGVVGFIVIHPELHSFPVLRVGKQWFIHDSWDPFVTLDRYGNLIDFFALQQSSKSGLSHHRLHRMFGPARQLIAKWFLNGLPVRVASTQQLSAYCDSVLIPPYRETHSDFQSLNFAHSVSLSNDHFAFAIQNYGRGELRQLSHQLVSEIYSSPRLVADTLYLFEGQEDVANLIRNFNEANTKGCGLSRASCPDDQLTNAFTFAPSKIKQ